MVCALRLRSMGNAVLQRASKQQYRDYRGLSEHPPRSRAKNTFDIAYTTLCDLRLRRRLHLRFQRGRAGSG